MSNTRGSGRAPRRVTIIALIVLAFLAGVVGRARVERLLGFGAAPEVPAGKIASAQLWTCGMHPQVIQDSPGFCPICGMALTPVKTDVGTLAATTERQVRYWWDPMMNPPYISDRPGKSPMGMDLIPVYADQVSAGPAVTIDPVIVQNMGVRVATVTEGPLRKTVRAVGYMDEAQPAQHDVNLCVSGWIERLYANTEGMHLRQGDPLFDLYSPDLQVGIEELIAAQRAVAALPADSPASSRKAVDVLDSAARRKLRLWGLDDDQISRLARLANAPRSVTFTSPISGHLIEKPVVEGSAVQAGQRVLRIVDHSTLWLDVQIFGQDLPFVHLGQPVRARIEGVPGRTFTGEVSFIHPHVETMTRTAMVRVALVNEFPTVRPGMYATVELSDQLVANTVLIPREAVIDTGTRQITFVARGGGHFEPRTLTVGASGDDSMVQVLAGVAPGETVVTSGQFLLDAESRLQEAIQKYLREGLLSPAAAPHVH